ncbi:hypothetical protein L218DRAFT_983309 [Marasmius fiardii PR-910]|nr:hypothetical protein L218DRAFT_983309 [Marasmius fiardii PR-910]
MDSRKKIVQMIVGGMTQYLTQVQGIPKNVEKLLSKRRWRARFFGFRSEELAIEVMWLKNYLNLTDERPIWGKVADVLLAAAAPASVTEQNVEPKTKSNYFLQSWETKISFLPDNIKRLIKVAKEVNLQADRIAFSGDILKSRPLWYHRGATGKIRQPNHSRDARCLRDKHNVKTKRSIRANDECECVNCMYLEDSAGCNHPHSCTARAKELLDAIHPKWDPRQIAQPEKYELDSSPVDDFEEIDSNVTSGGTLANIFTIFGNERKPYNSLPERKDPTRISLNEPYKSKQTIEAAELTALDHILSISRQDIPIRLEVVSKQTKDLLLKRIQGLEKKGWIGVTNKELLQKIWIKEIDKDNPGALERMKRVKKMAKMGCSGPEKEINLEFPRVYRQTGAKLTAMAQSLAYKGIRERKKQKSKRQEKDGGQS